MSSLGEYQTALEAVGVELERLGRYAEQLGRAEELLTSVIRKSIEQLTVQRPASPPSRITLPDPAARGTLDTELLQAVQALLDYRRFVDVDLPPLQSRSRELEGAAKRLHVGGRPVLLVPKARSRLINSADLLASAIGDVADTLAAAVRKCDPRLIDTDSVWRAYRRNSAEFTTVIHECAAATKRSAPPASGVQQQRSVAPSTAPAFDRNRPVIDLTGRPSAKNDGGRAPGPPVGIPVSRPATVTADSTEVEILRRVALRELGQELDKLRQLVDQLSYTEDELRSQVGAVLDSVADEALKPLLGSVPVTDLTNQDAASELVRVGIESAAQIHQLTRDELLSRASLGAVTAQSVRTRVAELAQDFRKQIRPYPNPDKRRAADTRLLQLVQALADYRRSVAPRLAECRARARVLESKAEQLRTGGDVVSFSNETRDPMVAAAIVLTDAIRDATAVAENLLKQCDPHSIDADTVWRAYSENNAEFVSIIEQLCPAPPQPPVSVGARSTSATGQVGPPPGPPVGGQSTAPPPAYFGGLPPELARQIENFTLETGPLLASLRRYQEFGAKFMALRGKVILGDDMGLGKTVQVLALMCHLHARGERHFLVVAPNSVLINWERETRRHTRLVPHILHGPQRNAVARRWRERGGVAVTTYGTLNALMSGTRSMLPIDLLVVDEAHYAKNPEAQRSRTVASVASQCKSVALLTGTALENRLAEMGNLVNVANPSMVGLIKQLRGKPLPDPHQVRSELAPVYLRRKQTDVLHELPECTDRIEWVELSGEDRNAYERSLGHIMTARRAAVVGAGRSTSGKFRRLEELLDEYKAEGRKVVIFSFFTEVLDRVCAMSNAYRIDGNLTASLRQGVIDRFKAQPDFAVIAMQIEAGGVGLNLQAAQVVILMEPQFTPAKERQAIARVLRMGQAHNVMVHRLVSVNTIEDRMLRLLATKLQLFEEYADPSALKKASDEAIDGAMKELEKEQAAQSLLKAERAALARS